MWPSCRPHTIEQFLDGKGPKARALWDALVELVREIGPFDFVANKTTIGFMVRVPSERRMTAGFWLKRRIDSPRFTRVELIPPKNWIYTFRVTSPEQLDDEVRAWFREAYDVWCQKRRSGPDTRRRTADRARRAAVEATPPRCGPGPAASPDRTAVLEFDPLDDALSCPSQTFVRYVLAIL